MEVRARRVAVGEVKAKVASGALKQTSKFGLGNRPAEYLNQFGAFHHPSPEATKDLPSINYMGFTPPFEARLLAIGTHHHNYIEGAWILISAAGKPMTETMQKWVQEGKCGLLPQPTEKADNRGKSWIGGLTAEMGAGAHDTSLEGKSWSGKTAELTEQERLGPINKYATEAFALGSGDNAEFKACLMDEVAKGNAKLICQMRYDAYAIQYDEYDVKYYGYTGDQVNCDAQIGYGADTVRVDPKSEVSLVAFMPGGWNGYTQHNNIELYFNVDGDVEKMKEFAATALSEAEKNPAVEPEFQLSA